VTDYLARSGIVVSAGHCDPSLDQLRAAIDAGLSMFTQLGNGCPGQLDRHDNIIQRVLSLRDRLWISWIADGVHIPYSTLGNYLRCAGLERSVVVTDAISAAGLGPGKFSISGRDVFVGEHLATRYADDASHLVGSAATMPMMTRGLVQSLGLSSEAARQLTSSNPRRILESNGS
jgi:N-acetylglucosamine-6-phosphate deacetylase